MSVKRQSPNSEESNTSLKKIRLEKSKPIFRLETVPQNEKQLQCISIPATQDSAICVGRKTPNFIGMYNSLTHYQIH